MSSTQTVDYKWTDYQAHVRDELESGRHDLVVLRIGYGGGKSICGSQWIHRGGMADNAGDGESVVMAQDYEKGKSTTFGVYFKTLPGNNTNPFKAGDPENSPIVANYNKNDKRLVYITGHTVWLGGADKWSRFAGGEYARIWCDEVGHYPPTTDLYDLYEMLITRQRTEVGPNSTLWTSTGNGYNQFWKVTEQQIDKNDDELSWAENMHVVVASTEHNTLLPDDGRQKIIRQFEGTPREEQGLHGGFAAAEGLVYSDFSRNRHVVDTDNMDDRMHSDWRIYGYDHGWSDPRVVLEAGKTNYDQLVILDEFYREGVEYDEAVQWLTTNEKPTGTMFAEHEPEHQRAFSQAGYPAEAAIKDLDEGIPAVRNRLDWRDDPEGRPGLLIDESCTNLIRELQDYQEEEVGTAGAVDHAADSLRYLIMGQDHEGESTTRRSPASTRPSKS